VDALLHQPGRMFLPLNFDEPRWFTHESAAAPLLIPLASTF
jgi:hypothetical protein